MAHVIKLLLVRNLPGGLGTRLLPYMRGLPIIMLVNFVNEYPQPMGIIIGMAMV